MVYGNGYAKHFGGVKMPFGFRPARDGEQIVFGAKRPGHPSKCVDNAAVNQWIDYMKRNGIQRVCCLLDKSQLDYYEDLLGSYRNAFGNENVCHAPVKDFELCDAATLRDKILPFLKFSDGQQSKVVVHCSGGHGRSGFIMTAWLINGRGVSVEDSSKKNHFMSGGFEMNADLQGERKDIRNVLQKHVDSFTKTIGYGEKLLVSDPYYPYDDPDGTQQYPTPDEPGCYIYATGNGDVLYVGRASRYLGSRIWAHIGRRKKTNEDGQLYPCAEEWLKQNQPNIAVWCIAVPCGHWWLALALEGFLSEVLLPSRSRQI